MSTLAALLLALAGPDDGPDFSGVTWVDGPPDLRGKVALVRWWTDGCALCSTSAPALSRLSDLAVVVAVYHPKPPRDAAAAQVRDAARAIGMPGKLGIDRDWAVLDRWREPSKRKFTSLTFVVDRKGKVRHVHEGGAILPEGEAELRRKVEALLAEKE